MTGRKKQSGRPGDDIFPELHDQAVKHSGAFLLLKICSLLKITSQVTGSAFFSMLLTPQYFSCESITAFNTASCNALGALMEYKR
jgi:hypothetical protein